MQQSALIVLAEFDDAARAALIAFDDVGVLGTGAIAGEPSGFGAAAPLPATPAGGRASSTTSSSAATGSSSRRSARGRVHAEDPVELWESVLTRKGGSYALVARMPPDPSVN